MKLKDVTKQQANIISIIKANSPPGTEVKVYERDSAKYIHSVDIDSQMLSISHPQRNVSEKDWIYGIRKIMKLNLVDAMISVRPSGVVIIREKSETIPRVVN